MCDGFFNPDDGGSTFLRKVDEIRVVRTSQCFHGGNRVERHFPLTSSVPSLGDNQPACTGPVSFHILIYFVTVFLSRVNCSEVGINVL
jgi:hypothetical protein